MVHREDPDGLIVISQPAHAWMAGQMARQWGNADFGAFSPWAEVCLAAEQHDIGFLEWEKAPTLDAASGRPHQFLNLPTRPHLDLWSGSVLKLMAYSRYAALLVSLHVTHLCQNNKVTKKPRDAQAIQDYLDQQHAIQSELLGELREDPAYASSLTPETLDRNTRLLAAWDWLSLVIGLGRTGTVWVENVPTARATARLRVIAADAERTRFALSPWPFPSREVGLVCDGRRLAETSEDQNILRRHMQNAPRLTLRFTLVPGD